MHFVQNASDLLFYYKKINQSIKSVRRRSVPLSLTWIYLPFGKYNKNNRENDT